MVSTITKLENAEKVVEKRRGESRTYTEPLPDNDRIIELYQAEFYRKQLVTSISLKAMQDELILYPHTLGEHYKLLVPNLVSFDQFFCRYYYRCSIDRVVDELSKLEQDEIKIDNNNIINTTTTTTTTTNNSSTSNDNKNTKQSDSQEEDDDDNVDDLSFLGDDEDVSDNE